MHFPRDSWFINFRLLARPALRLFCFPHAGGSAAVFHRWAENLGEGVEVWAANLPGHGSRLQETPLAEMELLVDLLTGALSPFSERPFAFFGHSLGGRLGFEVARALRRQGRPLPVHLFVAACPAPDRPPETTSWHTLPDDDMLAELRRYNGLPEAVLDEPELLALVLPVLRADLAMLAAAGYEPERPLALPITVLGGRRDPLVKREALEAWRDHTSGQMRLIMLDGDHFFPQTMEPGILAGILSEA